MASYPANWDEISDSVRARDGNRCVSCGREGVLLHVHHLKPLAEGGSNDPSNLVLLCAACHEKIQGERIGKREVGVSIRSGYLCLNCDRIYSIEYARERGLMCPVCNSALVHWVGGNRE